MESESSWQDDTTSELVSEIYIVYHDSRSNHVDNSNKSMISW